MTLQHVVICALLVPLLAHMARAGAGTGEQNARTFETKIPVKFDYLLYLPEDYGKDPQQKFPVILFLHGAGERGNDVSKVASHGPAKLLKGKTDLAVKDFIVISPQCAADRWWQPYEVFALLDKMMGELKQADADRVYLTGLSMGGFGTWEMATIAPDRFAAIAPICGGGNVLTAPKLHDMPIWVFHGDKDKIVPVQRSIEMVEALKKVGSNVRFTRYPEAGHDSWTETYNNPELYEWFLQHRRSDRQKGKEDGRDNKP
jgi:predicted peptidase